MQPRRLFVEPLESRIVLNGIGLGTESPGSEWDHVIVMLNERAANPGAVAERVLGPLGGRVGHVYQHALKGFSAQLPAAAVERLDAHFMVREVESNQVLHTQDEGEGQIVPTGVQRIGALQNSTANIGGGTEINVGIAILDTGIDIDHSDLNVVGGAGFWTVTTGPPRNRGNFSSEKPEDYDDDNGHGTHVAGIAAAKDNDIGVVGVAPGARLYSVKVLGANGSGNMADIIAGVDWVTENADDIQVANMSLGGTGQSTALRTAIQSSVGAGVVYFVSAGNEWRDILGEGLAFPSNNNTIPAAFPEVATISAFADSDGEPGGEGHATSWGEYGEDDAWWHPSNFSNSDDDGNSWYLEAGNNPVTSPGLGIDLVMPGVDIYSTYLNNGYATFSGTSMAAPHAAGLAALYVAENGRATDAKGVYAIRQALIDQGKSWRDPDWGLADWWGPDTHEENLGWAGDPDTDAALTVSITEPEDGAEVSGTVEIQATASADPRLEVASVEFLVDETSLGDGVLNSETGVWSVSWDTDEQDAGEPLYPDGEYTIEARATVVLQDEDDLVETDSVTVSVANKYAEPTVEIIFPKDGDEVSGTVEIQATASADPRLEVASVEFLVDETSLGGELNSETGVWSVSWDTDERNDADEPLYPDGDYTIEASATIVLDNETIQEGTDSITVMVDNTEPEVATMTVELEGEVDDVNRNMWEAIATVTVTDASGFVTGATVSGRWDDGAIVTEYTDSDGVATFYSGNLRYNRVDSITFTLENVVADGYDGYEAENTEIEFFSGGDVEVGSAWRSLEDELLSPVDPSAYLSAVDQLMATAW